MISLSNYILQFGFDPDQFTWTLSHKISEYPQVQNVGMAVNYQTHGQWVEINRVSNLRLNLDSERPCSGPLGLTDQICLTGNPDANGVVVRVSFGLPENMPMLVWQLALENRGPSPIQVQSLDLMRIGEGLPGRMRSPGSTLKLHAEPGKYGFFSNGWQSWSYTGAYQASQRARSTRLGPVQAPMCSNPETPRMTRAGRYTSDFFGVIGDRTHRRGVLAGFLSQKQHFGSLDTWLQGSPGVRMWANGDQAVLLPGNILHTDWAVLNFLDLDDPDPLADYMKAVARENEVTIQPAVPVGWCSWYHFYTNVTAQNIEQNLSAIQSVHDRLPLDLVQIDDGFESQVGDWFSFKPTFPEGVAPLAKRINESGLTPGLWLAPFILHPAAKLVRDHPDYVLRTRLGVPVNAGFVWNVFTTALDLTHPGALDYACRVVETASKEWGFPYLKLDFLYAAALPGWHIDRTRTRAQVLRSALEALRRVVGPETTLLGCGVPLGSAIGLFDAMRIGADVSGDWEPRYFNVGLPFRGEPAMPSASNAIQNMLTRAPMHRRWWMNDPDCLLVRPDTHLSLAEVQTLATAIAMTGGSVLLSDDLPNLPEERLKIAAALLPPVEKRVQVLDWFDESTPRRLRLDLQGPAGPWHVLAWFNWSGAVDRKPLRLQEFGLEEDAVYSTRLFWTGQQQLAATGTVDCGAIPPHGVALLAVRKFEADRPAYLGSDLHFSQGLELTGWTLEENQVTFTIDLGREAAGYVYLYLPVSPQSAEMGELAVEWQETVKGVFRFPVQVHGKTTCRIGW